MMGKKYKFIINPIAGQGFGKLAVPIVDQFARQASLDYEILNTAQPGHAIDLAREAAAGGSDFVIAVGGDGTSNEVLNGLMQAVKLGYRDTCMGIIGIGRGNDFAFAYGINPGIETGFQNIRQNLTRGIDVGLVVGGDYPQGRYFGNGVGIGFDAVVGFEAAKITRIHGFLNYVVAALRTIFLYFHAPLISIEYENMMITQPCLMISIMNGRRMGGGFMMAPNAYTDDGKLDLCIAGQLSRLGILAMIPRFMKGTQAGQRAIKTGHASKIVITAIEGVLPVHADGETICKAGKELTIELIKQPIKILHGHTVA